MNVARVEERDCLHDGREAVDEGKSGELAEGMTGSRSDIRGAGRARGAHGRCHSFSSVLETRGWGWCECKGQRVREIELQRRRDDEVVRKVGPCGVRDSRDGTPDGTGTQLQVLGSLAMLILLLLRAHDARKKGDDALAVFGLHRIGSIFILVSTHGAKRLRHRALTSSVRTTPK